MLLPDQFNSKELRLLRSLNTPAGIQRFLDREVAYNGAASCLSVRSVLDQRRGHCMEGSLLAAAALELLGHPPLLVDLEAVRDDDHVLAVFREGGCWGAIAKSNYSGLRFREPVYRSIRELAMSYFEDYFNLRGEKSLRAYSRPVSLRRFDRVQWQTSESEVWAIPEHLVAIPHIQILTPAVRGWTLGGGGVLARPRDRFRSPRAPHEPARRWRESSPDWRPGETPIPRRPSGRAFRIRRR